MIQEEKELLLKDLCARLPYMPKIKITYHQNGIKGTDEGNVSCDAIEHIVNDLRNGVITDMQIYLRPMSRMTEEESAELSNIINEWFDKELFYLTEEPFLEYALSKINYSISPQLFDWFNKHHFDYRGLISKGLAIEALDNMY